MSDVFDRAARRDPRRGRLPRALVRLGGRRALLRGARPTARRSPTPTAAPTSTTCSRGARRSSATPTPRWSRRSPRAAADGTSFGAPTEREVRARGGDRRPGSRRSRRCAWSRRAPRPAMTAVRLARGVTGRAKILKFAGCYHGHVDSLLVAAGSGVATLGIPGSAGVTAGTVADTLVVALQRRRRARRGVRRRTAPTSPRCWWSRSPPTWAWCRPRPGSSSGLRRRCTDAGALLVCDEVITGFRARPRRRAGALRHHPRPLDVRQGRRRRACRSPRSAAAPR